MNMLQLWNATPGFSTEEVRTMRDMLHDPRPIAGGSGKEDPDDPGKPNPDDDGDKPGESDKDTPDHESEAKKWKALARKHETQAKANADAAKKLKELEDADKSEIEKAAAKAAEAEKRAADAELKALRLEVASDKKLTPAQAKRLVGSTREELEADADDLLDTFKPADEEKDDSGRPKEKLKPGASPESDDEKSAKELLESIPRGI
jgi:hypothetical protein